MFDQGLQCEVELWGDEKCLRALNSDRGIWENEEVQLAANPDTWTVTRKRPFRASTEAERSHAGERKQALESRSRTCGCHESPTLRPMRAMRAMRAIVLHCPGDAIPSQSTETIQFPAHVRIIAKAAAPPAAICAVHGSPIYLRHRSSGRHAVANLYKRFLRPLSG